jgi:hypothetical protein
MSTRGRGNMRKSTSWSMRTLTAIVALKQCGLWKFYWCPFMRAQPRLLNALVDYWHPDVEAFMLEGKSLTPTTEDIYFLNGLSRRGEPFNLHTFPPRPFNIINYIGMHCEVGTEESRFSGAHPQDHQLVTEGDHFSYWADH